eukprot:gene1458-1610_t
MATVAAATATRSVYKIKRLNKQLQAATANTRRVKQTLRQMLQLFIRHSNQSAGLLKRAEDKNKILYSTVAAQIEVNARLREQLEQQPSPPTTTATDLSQKCCCCCRLHSHNNTTTADRRRRHHVSGNGDDDKDEAISITSSVDDFLESNNSNNSDDDDDNIETYNPPSDGFSQKIMFNIPARHDDNDDDSLMKKRKSDNDDSITEALHQLTENNK